ncbi:MAG TPA: peptidoglycan endopeptidase [Sphingopyxis sp.]|uniref:peptidoglycan endopeptidase n=1 Tax=Sphingopyxis sp. TaxID=1908224 RepID=UPI002E3280F2|nr:peptidoglycan endopeptidase [Sphingopyxis sp.]HEX2811407.1 peptidoglycan endopeptidase [Sphingopyxis sp.]
MGDGLGACVLAAARGMIGARFRPQGRDPATGLDCVGLVWAAYAAAGYVLPLPTGYPLRGWGRERVEAALAATGFERVDDGRDGDVALIALAAGQFHFGVMGAASFVHAHAGLRRVVETPVDAAAMRAASWRLCAFGED